MLHRENTAFMYGVKGKVIPALNYAIKHYATNAYRGVEV
jgi:hypothetical protein